MIQNPCSRSAEYAAMREAFSPEAVEDLLREMPPFEDKKQSALEQRLCEKEGEDSADMDGNTDDSLLCLSTNRLPNSLMALL